MRFRKWHILIITALLLILPLAGGCLPVVSEPSHQAVEGVLDLTEWQPEAGIVKLDGQWRFYWDELLEPGEFSDDLKWSYIDFPGAWNGYHIDGIELSGEGYATYRLMFETSADVRLAVKMPRVFTAYQLWVNEKPVASAGTVGTDRATMTPQYLPQVAIFDAKAGENEIVIQVSNFYHRSGGILESIIIGSEKHILDLRSKNIAYELFLFGGLLIIGLYHLALFSFRKRDYSALYFGLFCLLIASRTILVGERFFIHLYPGFNWEVAHKVQTLAFYLGVPVIVMFFKSVFPQDISSRILRIIQVVGFSFAGLVLLTPARIFSVVNPAYQLFALLVIIYLVYAMTGVLRRKEPEATLVVVGALVLFAASINDIVFLSVWMSDHGSLWLRSIIRSDSLSSFGQLVFVFTQSLVLAQKSAFAFDKQEEMTRKLTEINIDLDKIVSKRTVALEKSKQEVERQKAKLEKVNQVLKILTLKDPLTDLWNRRHFDQTLEMEWKRCLRNQRPLAVLLIDVDFFKGYNDAYGHQAGDQCLIKVAHAIDGMFNRASDLVARYGGDEFVVIIPEAGEEEAVKMALSLCQAIEGLKIPSDDLTGEYAYVTVSIGVSSRIPDRGSSPMDLFQLADRALYQAKHAGRNQVKFLAE